MKTLQAPTRTAAILAQLLERLDASRQAVDAHQYRTVAARLSAMLANTDIDWQPLLEQSPAATALYENLHYGDAGLCRSPLDAAMRAEMAACDAIAAARAKPAPDTAAPDAAPAA
ncbi:hypothetical protein H0I39_02445 [Ottowia beijingensis]|uniref:Uncharacterized protein n=1 Tax=Ottowia beijingensis TaxID=1207057 RepID=A0A853IKV7_9BURK|nr:hypothetical protein [Ottowia beijingensis]